jgi:hypothetical protein
MAASHEHAISGGHLGTARTYAKIKERYYWPGLYSDVQRWVDTCIDCSARREPQGQQHWPAESIPVPAAPWSRVSVDVTGPFNKSSRGNRFVLVFVDHLTRWVETVAIPRQRSIETARQLVEKIFCRYGAPRALLSDRGPNFVSVLAEHIHNLLETTFINSTVMTRPT